MDPHAAPHAHAPAGRALASQAVRGGLLATAGAYSTIVFGFAANLVLTRLLLPEHFGLIAIATFYFALLNLRTKVNAGYAFAQDRETSRAGFTTFAALDLAASLVTVALAAAVMPLLGRAYSAEAAWAVLVLALNGVAESFAHSAQTALDKAQHLGATSLVVAAVFPLSYLPAFALALNGGGYLSLLAQTLTVSLLILGGQTWLLRRRLPGLWPPPWRFDRAIARRYLAFGVPLGLASLASVGLYQLDNFLIGTLVGVETLGYYDRAYRTAQWPILLMSAVVLRAALFTYARFQDDPPRLARSLDLTTWSINMVGLPIALAVFTSAPDLVRLLYGDRWAPVTFFLRLLLIFSVIRPLLDNANSLFIALKQVRAAVQVQLVPTLVLAVLGTALTYLYGAAGTAVAVVAAFSIGLLVAYRRLRPLVAISLTDAVLVPGVCAAVTLVLYWALIRVFPFDSLPLAARVGVKLGGTLLAFYAAALVVRPTWLTERSRYLLDLLVPRRSAEPPALAAASSPDTPLP